MAYTIEQLTAAGGSEWQKGAMHRVYFNDLPAWYGLETTRYHTGRIQSATLRGEDISNTESVRIYDRLGGVNGKLWYDLTDSKWHWQGIKGRDDALFIIDRIHAAIKGQTAATTA